MLNRVTLTTRYMVFSRQTATDSVHKTPRRGSIWYVLFALIINTLPGARKPVAPGYMHTYAHATHTRAQHTHMQARARTHMHTHMHTRAHTQTCIYMYTCTGAGAGGRCGRTVRVVCGRGLLSKASLSGTKHSSPLKEEELLLLLLLLSALN